MARSEERDRRDACERTGSTLTMPRRNHRPTCPACGAEPDRIVTLPQEIITCPGCGLETSAHEWSTHGLETVSGFARSSVIRSESSDGEIRWNIPAAGNAGFSISFWSCWCIAALVLALFIGIKTIPEYGVAALLLQLSFPVPVLAVGLVFLYLAMVRHHALHMITLTKDTLAIRRDVLGKQKHSAFPRSRIRHIIRIPTGRSANRNHEAIEIRAGKQHVRFGEHLSPEERKKLVDEMRLRVFGPPAPVADALSRTVPLPGEFSLVIKHQMLHYLPFACAAVITGALFMWVVLRFMSFGHSLGAAADPMFFRAIEWVATMTGNLMRVVFFLIAFVMISGGLWMLIHSLRTHLRQTSLEGTPSQIIVRNLNKRGRSLGERTFQRNESTVIRTSIQTITGGVTLKRLELFDGDVSTTIVSDIRAEDAEEIMRRLASSDAAP